MSVSVFALENSKNYYNFEAINGDDRNIGCYGEIGIETEELYQVEIFEMKMLRYLMEYTHYIFKVFVILLWVKIVF